MFKWDNVNTAIMSLYSTGSAPQIIHFEGEFYMSNFGKEIREDMYSLEGESSLANVKHQQNKKQM